MFGSPLLWEIGGWLVFLLVGGLFIKADYLPNTTRRQQLGLFLSLIGLLIFKRLLILFVNRELNPDESQLLSQAITLRHHPVYWKYVDGATMGPLSCYYVALPGYFGVPLNYMVLRWVSFFCLGISVASCYLAIENFFNARVARLAILPSIAFLAFTTNLDFLHATNEQVSLALLGLALWQYSRVWKQRSISPGNLFLLGFISSLVPFAKLQGTPTALVIVAFALYTTLRQYAHIPKQQFWKSLVGLILGGVIFPLVVVLLTLGFGVFDDFVHFYIQANFAYSAGESFWHYLAHFPVFVWHTTDFFVFLLPTVGLFVGWLLWSRKAFEKQVFLIFSLVFLAASAYAIIKPGNEFTHYLLYLVAPVCLLNAWLLNSFKQPIHTIYWVVFIVASVGLGKIIHPTPADKNPQIIYHDSQMRQFYISPASAKALELAKRGSDLVVWGWAPKYNVETQMPQGVCDNHVIRCVMGSDQEAHRARYMRNIQASKPPIFMDAVGPNSTWLNDREKYGYEVFPELKNYIDTHYRYVGEFSGTRVFARTDRNTP